METSYEEKVKEFENKNIKWCTIDSQRVDDLRLPMPDSVVLREDLIHITDQVLKGNVLHYSKEFMYGDEEAQKELRRTYGHNSDSEESDSDNNE